MVSSPSLNIPLSRADLSVLRCVLDDAALATGQRNVAALLVIRLFQSGLASPELLSKALKRCIADDATIADQMFGHLAFGTAPRYLATEIKVVR